jgi:hypothetical protein
MLLYLVRSAVKFQTYNVLLLAYRLLVQDFKHHDG